MTMAALMMHSLATQAAHVAEVNPGAAAATGFVRYFDYPGPLNVTGAVLPILYYNEGTKLRFFFEGLDPMCAEGRGESAISCGMHIHEGTSCDEAAGGLFFAEEVENPWLDVFYTATPEGSASGFATIMTGLAVEEVVGKVFVVHDYAGTFIACSVITEMPEIAHAIGMVPYAGYMGNLTMAAGGAYPMISDGTTTKFTFDVIGTDPMCKDGAVEGVAVSCGLHVHVGTTCEEMAGDLYFAGEMNPWLDVSYMTMGGEDCTMESVMEDPASCYLTGEFEMAETMLTLEDVTGKVFVIHDSTGIPYACATVQPDIGRAPLSASMFTPYYNYDAEAEGALMVMGMISPVVTQPLGLTDPEAVLGGMPAQSFSYDLTGVDPACADGPSDAAYSCGIHIHEGMSCDESAGGLYYSPVTGEDPWLPIIYNATSDGNATGVVLGVATGYPASMIVGHAMVVHDRAGTPVACALLSEGMPMECPEGCMPAGMMMYTRRRNLLFSTMPPTCPDGCEPAMMM